MQASKIQVRGQIDKNWSEWLASLDIDHTYRDNTVMSGFVRDQAALYGLLFQLSNLGFQLVSLTCGDTGYPGRRGGWRNMKAQN
jgi:hypothetical protein